MAGMLGAERVWVETFTGLQVMQFGRLLRVVRERGVSVHLRRRRPAHGTPTSQVRAVITTASPPSATSSTIRTDSPENAIPVRKLTSITRA